MSARRYTSARFAPAALGLLMLAITLPAWGGLASVRSSAVGGVLIDAQGVLTNAEVDEVGRLRELRQEMLKEVPADLKQPSKLRKVSLRGLEAAIAERKRTTQMPLLADEMHYLAGLTRIQYVLVYPEQNDIVLAGPAEGWKVDAKGTVVGASTGLPILQLDHLLVALRTAEAAAGAPISCSIDPTPEGIRRFQAFMKSQKQFSPAVLGGIEQALGMQTITINGVSDKTDFARILVAADFRMKRLGMGFDKSPIKGMPSYLEMITAAGAQSAMPRWWMAPNYEALLKDPEGLAWELRGPGVKCMTEDSLFAADGTRQQTGATSAAAQRWADLMTENYEELCVAEPIFGELRNIMDMAVISALIVRERLRERAEFPMSVLMSPEEIAVDDFNAPKQVNSQASALKKGRNWIISASGGVEINSHVVANRTETSPALAAIRQPKPAQPRSWYWE
jgi:hypothetical protein